MFGIMKAGARRRREEAEQREKACIAEGCKCYCHAPSKGTSGKDFLLIILAFVVLYGLYIGLLSLAFSDSGPREPYYCTTVTSTGAPADCHPVVMPPETLKKYEEQFKK